MSITDVRFSPSIRRVIVLSHDPSGVVAPTLLYERKRGKKRQSQTLKPFEMVVRRVADGVAESAHAYAVKHRKANGKQRDGWIRHINNNVMRAGRTGMKRAKLTRWMAV